MSIPRVALCWTAICECDNFPDHLLEPDFIFVARIPQFFKQD